MDDLVSRKVAIDAMDNRIKQHLLENRFESFEEADSETKWFCDGIMESIGAVMDLPSAHPQKMRGRWEMLQIPVNPPIYKCSECGDEFVLIDGTPKDNNYFFCPACGADMREEHNGENMR